MKGGKMKKLILLVIILLTPGLLLAKEASMFSKKTQTIYEPAFWSDWNPKEQMLDFGRVDKNIKLGPEMSVPGFLNAKTSSAPSNLYHEFADIHKAALKMQNKYLGKKYTLSSYSRFGYFTLKGWGKRIELYEYETRRLLFTYQDEEEEDSMIYSILERESLSSWKRRKRIRERKKELDNISHSKRKKKINKKKKKLNNTFHSKKKRTPSLYQNKKKSLSLYQNKRKKSLSLYQNRKRSPSLYQRKSLSIYQNKRRGKVR